MSDPGAAHPPVRADRDDAALILSKVRSPVVRSTTLARPRLLGWLDAHAGDRVRILATEAGYGKTTLLADWARRTPQRVVWYRLDTSDGDWITFIAYLIAAFREETPGFGASTERLLAHVGSLGTTLDQALGSFLAELGAALHERTVVIVDDIHLVNGRTEVRALIERLVERAPEPVTFIFSGRTRPDVRLARLAAQGTIAELDTDRLRFTSDETRDLFAEGYGTPLDADLLPLVEERTEGWAASLQLLDSSIRGREPGEARSFIASLRGSTGPIYEYLAEEVLERQTPVMRTLLVRASLLDRIWPPLVVAALSVLPDGPSADHIGTCLDLADELGLMSRNAVGSASRRFHPLLRDFLHAHLTAEVDAAEIREMHRRVAVAAEAVHWPTAAHHYIEADLRYEAMRVIGSSSVQALGTGAWGPAMELVERMPDVEPSVAVKVLRARSLVAKGDPVTAIELLERLDIASLDGDDRALVRLALANALNYLDNPALMRTSLHDLEDDPTSPEYLRLLARGWGALIDSAKGASLTTAGERLQKLAVASEAAELWLYAGLARHNLAVVNLLRAEAELAEVNARRAIDLLAVADDAVAVAASTHMCIAWARADKADWGASLVEAATALGDPSAEADVVAEGAMLALIRGDLGKSGDCLVRAEIQNLAGDLGARTLLQLARRFHSLVAGTPVALPPSLHQSPDWTDPTILGLNAVISSTELIVLGREDEANRFIESAATAVKLQGATRWLPAISILKSVAASDPEALGSILGSSAVPEASLLWCVDAIALALAHLRELPSAVTNSVVRWPSRWRPALRRAIDSGRAGSHTIAALSLVGEREDVARISTWERASSRRVASDRASQQLARRLAPTLRVMDLGRGELKVGSRAVPLSRTRKKASALLLYLASRPGQTATRDQVTEDLWPNLDDDQAANSLHQTIYFLRRDIDPEYRDGNSIDYVLLESDLVYLDSELVQTASGAFARQAAEFLRVQRTPGECIPLLASYPGRFAVDFEYEDWAIPWRDTVHATYLRLAEVAIRGLISQGEPDRALGAIGAVLAVDPQAIEIEAALPVALVRAGSRTAAEAAYARYSERYRVAFDADAPTLPELIAEVDGHAG